MQMGGAQLRERNALVAREAADELLVPLRAYLQAYEI